MPFAVLPFRLNPRAGACLLVLAGMTAAAPPARAQAASAAAATAVRDYDLPAGPLGASLNRIAREAGLPLTIDAQLLEGRIAAPVRGRLDAPEALRRALAGSGLELRAATGGVFTLREAARPAAQAAQLDGAATLGVITVAASAEAAPGQLPPAYAGGQVASGSRVGLLGNQDVMDTPFNTTSYTALLIENQQARTIADVLANDSSVRAVTEGQSSAAGAGDSFVVRGFPLRNQDVSFNGMYGLLPQRNVSMEMAERVEVLKGPNALLGGMAPRGSLGGAINVVPKRAADEPLARLTANYESEGRFGTQVDLGRRFGENGAYGIRFNGAYRDGDTAVQGQSARNSLGALGLDYRSDRLRLSADLGHQKGHIDAPGNAGVYVVDGFDVPAPAPARGRRGFAQPWAFSGSRDVFGVLRAEYDFTPALTGFAAVGTRHSKNVFFSTDPYIVNAAGDLLEQPYHWPMYEDNTSAQVGARGAFTTGAVRHQVNVTLSTLQQESGYLSHYGLPAFGSNLYHPSVVAAPSLAGLSHSPPRMTKMDLPTLAVADTMSFAQDRVLLTLGVRRQRVDIVNYAGLTTGEESSRYEQSATTPAVGLVVKPWPGVSLYANHIQGLAAGPTAPAGTSNAGELFAPIKTRQSEAGVKVDRGSVTTTFSVFQIQQPQGIAVADGVLSRPRYAMAGRQRNRGAELQGFGELARSVRVLGGITYTQGKMVRTADPELDGRTATGVPRWLVNLGAEWDVPAVRGLTLGARSISTSAQYQNATNTRQVPGWTRWDLNARYVMVAFDRPVSLRATVQNAFGKDYWSSVSDGWLYQGAPRTVLLSASIDF